MAVHFTAPKPDQLLAAFDARIAQAEPKGKITTWNRIVFKNVAYYTHTADQWYRMAFFKPMIGLGQLTFHVINPESKNISTLVYGYYHGHLTETFLNHFDEMFTHATSTASPIEGDRVAP